MLFTNVHLGYIVPNGPVITRFMSILGTSVSLRKQKNQCLYSSKIYMKQWNGKYEQFSHFGGISWFSLWAISWKCLIISFNLCIQGKCFQTLSFGCQNNAFFQKHIPVNYGVNISALGYGIFFVCFLFFPIFFLNLK